MINYSIKNKSIQEPIPRVLCREKSLYFGLRLDSSHKFKALNLKSFNCWNDRVSNLQVKNSFFKSWFGSFCYFVNGWIELKGLENEFWPCTVFFLLLHTCSIFIIRIMKHLESLWKKHRTFSRGDFNCYKNNICI